MTGATKKSQRTREAILDAARTQFAEIGYERATVRSIAAAAGIDPAMVIRYFGSKDGLFASASEFSLRLPDLTAPPRDAVGVTLVRHFLELWEGNDTLQLLLRTGVTNPQAAAAMREIFGSQLIPQVVALGVDRPQERAGLAATQVLGLALCRYILAFPPIVALGHDELVSSVGAVVQRYLIDDVMPPAEPGQRAAI